MMYKIVDESIIDPNNNYRKAVLIVAEQNMMIQVGTIIHGTLRPEDLIPAFLKELERLDKLAYEALVDEYLSLGVLDCDGNLVTGRDNSYWYLLEEVEDTLGDLAPDGLYFGTLEGDGSDFGWWPIATLPGEDDYE